MKFDFMGIILMMVAIALGTIIGNIFVGMIGFAGGLIGTILVGAVVYLIWALLNARKMEMMDGVLFAVLVYLAQMIQNALSGFIGFGGSIIGLFFTAIILSLLVGFVLGPKDAPVAMGKGKTKGIL